MKMTPSRVWNCTLRMLTLLAMLGTMSGAVHAMVVKNLKTDYGAVGDGTTNDRGALSNALLAVSGGGTLIVPDGTYRIVGNILINLSGDVTIVGSGTNSVFKLDGSELALYSTYTNTTLAATVLQGGTVVRVSSNAAIKAGSVLYVTCNLEGELSWHYKKQDVQLIKAVADAGGGLVDATFGAPLNFGYTPSEPGHIVYVYSGRRVVMTGVDIEIATGGGRLHLAGTHGDYIGNMKFKQANGGKTAQSMIWDAAVDGTVANVTFDGLQNGLVMACCRNLKVQNIVAMNCGQPFIPCNFSDSLYINGVVGTNDGTMDSHPAFNVHYANVHATDNGLSDLRSIGGSIRDSVFTSLCTNGVTYFQSVYFSTNVVGNPYTNCDFVVENVEWNLPSNAYYRSDLQCDFARCAVFRNVKARALYFFGNHTVGEVHIDGCELGYIYTREIKMNVQSTTFDGNLNSPAGLLGLGAWQADPVFMDCTFKNADYVVECDYVPFNKRQFIRCSFEDIAVRFDNMSYPTYNYTYEFDDSDFIRVAGYGASLTNSPNVEVDNCYFTPGYPVL